MYGGRYAVWVSGAFAVEGNAGLLPTTRSVIASGDDDTDPVVLPDEAEVSLVQLDARLQFNLTGRRTWNRINPFLQVGGGVIFDVEGDQAEDQQVEADDRFDQGAGFVGMFGGGARVFLTDHFALRGDAGITLHKLDIPDGFRAGDPQVPTDEWVSSPTFTVTLLYRW